MNIPLPALLVTIVIFGFLTGSSLYFYNKAQTDTKTKNGEVTFDGQSPEQTKNDQPDAVDKLTKPAEPKGRPSYPANVYIIKDNETLFAIGQKFSIPWTLIVEANGLTNADVVQAKYPLVIPKLNKNTDYYRVNFILNDEKLSEINRELREVEDSEFFDVVKVVKKYAVPYFNVKETDEMTILEQDQSKGTAIVEAKAGDKVNVIGLIQPKVIGPKGLWTVLYIESIDE